MKRITAFCLAVLVCMSSMVTPARAFAPVAVLAAPQIVSAGGGTYALAALSGLVGLVGLYLTIEDANDNAVRIPLGPNANNQPPAPSAAATVSPSGDGASACNAWLAAQPQTQNYNGCTLVYSYTLTNVTGSAPNYTCTYTKVTTSNQPPACASLGSPYNQTQPNQSAPVYATPTCPTGYTLNGSNCQLQNARQATDDKTCDILLSTGQFATADDMNCGSTADGTKLSPILRSGKAIAYGTNSSGQPLMWEVTPGSTRYTLRQYEQVQTASQTQVQTTTVTVDAATSEITSVQVQTSPGTIETPGSQSVPTQADPTTENTPTVTQDATKPVDKITCGLPGTPACAIDDTQFTNRDSFSGPATSTASDQLDTIKDGVVGAKDLLPSVDASWLPSLLPGSATSCEPLPISFSISSGPAAGLSGSESLDLCPHFDVIRQVLGYLFGLAAVFYIWRSFTRSNEGT